MISEGKYQNSKSGDFENDRSTEKMKASTLNRIWFQKLWTLTTALGEHFENTMEWKASVIKIILWDWF